MEKKASKDKLTSEQTPEIVFTLQIKNTPYCLIVHRGEDLLFALDKFLKKNKINLRREIFRLELSFKKTGLISQRVSQAIVKGIIIAKEWL